MCIRHEFILTAMLENLHDQREELRGMVQFIDLPGKEWADNEKEQNQLIKTHLQGIEELYNKLGRIDDYYNQY